MEYLQQILREYEARQGLKIELMVQEWPTAWSELTTFATYRRGPDVSVVGTTWITTLEAMQALRPFAPAEIDRLDRAETFLRACL